ncbi:MAG: helix-turn-helix transcriptional regulator [Acutalibacteraceae bacterium]|nr:helix-turn-helix transcriptional regulator [Acutalibacteraceae bacterium]
MNERLKILRNTLGLTQQDFADKLNIKRGTVANYEIGRNVPIDAVISLICREFHVNEEWLRTGEGEMFQLVDDKLSAYVSEITDSDDYLIQSFIEAYMELDDISRAALKQLILTTAEKYKNKTKK